MSATAPLTGAPKSAFSGSGSPASETRRPQRGFSIGALLITLVQAGCAIIVAINRVSVALGFGAVAVAGEASFHDLAVIRLPMLALAALLAGFNVYIVYRGWRIRSNPAAAWRLKPLSRRDRLRIGWVLASGAITFALVIGELAVHHQLHPHDRPPVVAPAPRS